MLQRKNSQTHCRCPFLTFRRSHFASCRQDSRYHNRSYRPFRIRISTSLPALTDTHRVHNPTSSTFTYITSCHDTPRVWAPLQPPQRDPLLTRGYSCSSESAAPPLSGLRTLGVCVYYCSTWAVSYANQHCGSLLASVRGSWHYYKHTPSAVFSGRCVFQSKTNKQVDSEHATDSRGSCRAVLSAQACTRVCTVSIQIILKVLQPLISSRLPTGVIPGLVNQYGIGLHKFSCRTASRGSGT